MSNLCSPRRAPGREALGGGMFQRGLLLNIGLYYLTSLHYQFVVYILHIYLYIYIYMYIIYILVYINLVMMSRRPTGWGWCLNRRNALISPIRSAFVIFYSYYVKLLERQWRIEKVKYEQFTVRVFGHYCRLSPCTMPSLPWRRASA